MKLDVFKRLFWVFVFAFSALAGSVGAEVRDIAFRWTSANPSGHPSVKAGLRFSELVAERSGGKMIVSLYVGGVMGSGPDVLSSLQSGRIDFTVANSGFLQGLVKEYAIVDLPFLFLNNDEVDAIMDGTVGRQLADKLPAKGLINLAYYDLGFRNLTNSKRPVRSLDDLQGLNIRVIPSPACVDTFNALGAKAEPTPFTGVYYALEQKKHDGQENPFSVIVANKFDSVQKYLTITRHIYNPQSFLMSKKSWDRLSEEEQKIIVSAARDSEIYQRKISRDAEARSLAIIRKSLEVIEWPPEEAMKARDKLKSMIEKHSTALGQDFASFVFSEIEKLRKK